MVYNISGHGILFDEILKIGDKLKKDKSGHLYALVVFTKQHRRCHPALLRQLTPSTLKLHISVLFIFQDAFQTLKSKSTSKAGFFAAITQHSLSSYYDKVASGGYEVGDALAVVAALVPNAVVEEYDRRVAVELAGAHTRGQLVQAWTPDMLPHVDRTVHIVAKFNTELLSELFFRMLA